ncbi:MAG: FAD:protein FMN transferase [Phycisphaerales bacterium]|nr:FAD:protein FMN transferase [Phycisphaerales bacterium]
MSGESLVLAIAGAMLIAPHAVAERFVFYEIAMGCEVRIEVVAKTAVEAVRIARSGFDRIRALDETLSDFVSSSELRRLVLAARRPEPISPDLALALSWSLRAAAATDGAFDASAGAISKCWRDARLTDSLPSDAALAEAVRHSGWRHLTLTLEPPQVEVDCDGLSFDLGALGKGLAADEACQAIARAGCEQSLVAIAGDIACGTAPPWGRGWLIQVETGLAGDRPTTLCLVNACVSTSGDQSQRLDRGSVRHSHIFDPRTGRALTDAIAVTVVSARGAVADALSTAISVDPVGVLARQDEIAARLAPFEARIVRWASGTNATPSVETTSGWDRLTPLALGPALPPVPGGVAPGSATAASSSTDR